MIALKGKSDIGDKINTQIIAPLVDANSRLSKSDFPDFNDPNKPDEGDAMVQRLTNLISIFQKPELDFSQNRAEHDDILGDAYEYLMQHFATESGKSKGQFYTPSEVSRAIATVIGIAPGNTKASTTAYDPTCGSGSLLLKGGRRGGQAHHRRRAGEGAGRLLGARQPSSFTRNLSARIAVDGKMYPTDSSGQRIHGLRGYETSGGRSMAHAASFPGCS